MKLGILQIDLDLAIFQRTAVGFLIIGLLYYAQDFRGFLYYTATTSSVFIYFTATTSSVLFSIILKIYYTATTSSAGNAEYDYYSVDLRALPIVLHILISINSTFVPFVFNLPLNEIARTQFFVRWVDCNTPFPEYVLSCVFRFSDRIFRFTFSIDTVLWIPYMIVLSWIWIRGLGVSPSPNQEPDYSILLDLDIPVLRFDRF